MKNKELYIFNLDIIIFTAEFLYKKEENQILFKKDERLKQKLLIYIKEYYLNFRKINIKKKLLIDIENLNKIILINKIKLFKIIDNFLLSFNKNINALFYIFNKLLLAIQVIKNIIENINKLITI